MLAAVPELPQPGDTIYINSSFYISRGRDDVCGGKATVERIRVDEKCQNPVNRYWVYVKEVPGRGYNWTLLKRDQEKLKKEYGDRVAHPCPDNDPASNTGAL